MVQAYLRGLLKPYLNLHTISSGREELVLAALECESQAMESLQMLSYESSLLSALPADHITKAGDSIKQRFNKYCKIKNLEIFDWQEERRDDSINFMIKLFNALEEKLDLTNHA